VVGYRWVFSDSSLPGQATWQSIHQDAIKRHDQLLVKENFEQIVALA